MKRYISLLILILFSVISFAQSGGTFKPGITLYEPDLGGTNYLRIYAPSLSSNYTITLPNTAPSANQILKWRSSISRFEWATDSLGTSVTNGASGRIGVFSSATNINGSSSFTWVSPLFALTGRQTITNANNNDGLFISQSGNGYGLQVYQDNSFAAATLNNVNATGKGLVMSTKDGSILDAIRIPSGSPNTPMITLNDSLNSGTNGEADVLHLYPGAYTGGLSIKGKLDPLQAGNSAGSLFSVSAQYGRYNLVSFSGGVEDNGAILNIFNYNNITSNNSGNGLIITQQDTALGYAIATTGHLNFNALPSDNISNYFLTLNSLNDVIKVPFTPVVAAGADTSYLPTLGGTGYGDYTYYGKLGIGVAPTYPLHVLGNGWIDGALHVEGGNGDVDNSGVVNATDALIMLNYQAGTIPWNDNLFRGDVSGNMSVSSLDAVLVGKIFGGMTLDSAQKLGRKLDGFVFNPNLDGTGTTSKLYINTISGENVSGDIFPLTNTSLYIKNSASDTTMSVVVRTDGKVGVGTQTPTNKFEVKGTTYLNGAVAYAYKEDPVDAYVLTATDHIINYTLTTSKGIFLPAASTCIGREYVIKKSSSSGTITITRNGGGGGTDTFDGASSTSISITTSSYPNNYFRLVSTGTGWIKL